MKKSGYAWLITIPFLALGLNSCKKQEHQHKNVITGIGTFKGQQMLILSDVETGQERFYEFSDKHEAAFFDCFHINDTVTIITGGVYSGDGYYKDNIILYEDAVGMDFSKNNVLVRLEQRRLNKYKQQIASGIQSKTL